MDLRNVTPGNVRGSDSLDAREFFTLLEKGRQRALQTILHDPEARERIETAFGIDYCKHRYPEAYGITRPPVYDEPSGTSPVPFTL